MFINLSVFLIVIVIDTAKAIPLAALLEPSLLFLSISDISMFITIFLILYEWYFVITNQDVYTCQSVTSKSWVAFAIISIITHTIGVAYWFLYPSFYAPIDICYLYSVFLWFLCFCWEKYKMNKRSFAGLVNDNLNLILYILEASFVALFESGLMLLLSVGNGILAICPGLTTIGLIIIIAKMYTFRRKQKFQPIMANRSRIMIDKTIVLGLVLLITGTIANIVIMPLYIIYLWFSWVDLVVLLEYFYVMILMVFGCFSIFFNIISVIIP